MILKLRAIAACGHSLGVYTVEADDESSAVELIKCAVENDYPSLNTDEPDRDDIDYFLAPIA